MHHQVLHFPYSFCVKEASTQIVVA
jgi:hypothetical protein